jgi:GntR family transcriptional regulator
MMTQGLTINNKAIPLYYQLETILRKKIMFREFSPGTLLPSEDALAKEYNVSRVTVRQALSAMEKDGLIVRKRGKGTVVSERPVAFDPPKLTGTIEDLISMGIKTKTKIIDFKLTRVSKDITDALQLPEGTEVLRIERLRLTDGRPFSYIINYVPKSVGEKIRPDDLTLKPLLKILEDDLNINLANAYQRIEATIADSYVAPLLEIRLGDPLLRIERTVFDSHGTAVEYITVLYRADKYLYTVRLERKKTQNAKIWEPA